MKSLIVYDVLLGIGFLKPTAGFDLRAKTIELKPYSDAPIDATGSDHPPS